MSCECSTVYADKLAAPCGGGAALYEVLGSQQKDKSVAERLFGAAELPLVM